MNVVSFSKIRDSGEGPDAAFVTTDADEQRLYKFALRYDMDGKTWAADIWAYSFEDAEDRIAAMRKSLAFCGQLYSEVEA